MQCLTFWVSSETETSVVEANDHDLDLDQLDHDLDQLDHPGLLNEKGDV